MPLVRVPQGEAPLQSLEDAIKTLEANGHHVVSIQSWGGEWVIVTRPMNGRVYETRTRKPRVKKAGA